MLEAQRQDYELGEQYAAESRRLGILAAKHLFRAQWKYTEPEWYDHRLHYLDPERHQTDFWTMSADNVIRVLPLHGKLLDLCSGDGFYDYWFYRLRAQVTCIERNQGAYDFAVKTHSHPNITYILDDVLTYQPEPESFDVVLIRGAIEHFSRENQEDIIEKARDALKPGGYFCGDTPANKDKHKLLGSHKCEWGGEREMREMMSQNFSDIETWSLESETTLHKGEVGHRTTLFWRCRK